MTRMTGPDCAVMCNLINTHTHTHIHTRTRHFYHMHIIMIIVFFQTAMLADPLSDSLCLGHFFFVSTSPAHTIGRYYLRCDLIH